MRGFFLAAGAVGLGFYAYSKTRSESDGLQGVMELVSNPGVFGFAAGVGNGLLATVREKPMSLTANLVTAAVIGVSEGILTEDRERAFSIGMLSSLGASAGMAPFTRFQEGERALIENKAIPLLP